MYVDVSSELGHVLHDSRLGNQYNYQITLNKIKYCEIINLPHISELEYHFQGFFKMKEI